MAEELYRRVGDEYVPVTYPLYRRIGDEFVRIDTVCVLPAPPSPTKTGTLDVHDSMVLLQQAALCLDDCLIRIFPEEFTPEQRNQAAERFSNSGGTLSRIATVADMLRGVTLAVVHEIKHCHSGRNGICGGCGRRGAETGNSNEFERGPSPFGVIRWYECRCGNTWEEVENAT